jgi:sugar lactone lactonase YvrE
VDGARTEVACIQQANAMLGEAPVWHPQEERLYWADVTRPAIYAFEPGVGQVGVWPMPSEVGFLVPRDGGGVVAGLRAEGIVAVDVTGGGTLRPIVQPAVGKPPGRFNDARTDPMGRLWTGWLTDSRVMPGTLYRIDPDRSVHDMLDDIVASNGIGWSPDGSTFYCTDSHVRTIWAFAFDMQAGTLGDRRRFFITDASGETPDGMQVDAEGCVWTVIYNGGRVVRLSPDGAVLAEISLPARLTTSCAFGADGLATLFVTTAIREQKGPALEGQPNAGGLLALKPGVSGRADTPVRFD